MAKMTFPTKADIEFFLGMISAIFVLGVGPIIIFYFAREEYRKWRGERKPYIWDTNCDCIGEYVIPEHQYKEAF